jgi:uncharacterized protein YqgC (DUF456 family)
VEEYQAEQRPSMAKAVIIGGVVGGILGVIPPIFYGNCCCCLWYALGAVIAVLIYRSMAPYVVSAGFGSLLGLISGIVAGIISTLGLFFIFRIPLSSPELYDPESELNREGVEALKGVYKQWGMSDAQIDQFMDQYSAMMASATPETMLVNMLVGLLIMAVIGVVISVLAGMITGAVAGKKDHFQEEPPPYEPVS